MESHPNNDDRKPAAKRSCSQDGDFDSKKVKKEPKANNVDEACDSDVEVLSKGPKVCPAVASLPVPDDGDTDVEFVGATGTNALTDFPHARACCLIHPFQADPAQYCKNCFCYVCDTPAVDCTEWQEHCQATHEVTRWRQLRYQKANPTIAAAASAATPYQPYHRPTVQQLLDAVTRIYPSEVAPPSPPFVTELKHYQKQSLAFMMDVEKNYDMQQSGWICSDVGMGKSAVVIAAICANPMPIDEHPSAEQVKAARFNKDGEELNVKCTVIFTTKSLLGQWEDEVKKHAPHLTVYRVHGKSKLKLKDLADADVIVSTSTKEWSKVFTSRYVYHRVVVDESHLLGTVSARLEHVLELISDRNWCVTATPMVSSFSDLDKQIAFLSLEEEQKSLPAKEFLKKHMIRHTKSQRINGEVALCLPESTTTVTMVPMTEWERRTYREASDRKSHILWRGSYNGMLTKMAEMKWYSPIIKPITCADSSKLELLKKDLKALLIREPNMRAVVYSQFVDQYKFAREAVKSLGLKTYCFDGSKTADQRDKYIREFQSLELAEPAVFLVTLKAGSVGITLTAASHVFLLEPCIDPGAELQAAGRIHRLGQKKPVGVSKYVFENSCESNILKVHEKLQSGELDYTSGMLSRGALMVLRS